MGLQGWVDCFENSLKGMVSGGGIDAANTAGDHMDIMKQAYELGKIYKLIKIILIIKTNSNSYYQ